MGEVMTLLEVIRTLDSFDEESTIYASEPWTEKSKSVVVAELESDGLQERGVKYFLEVFIARQFLEEWVGNFGVEPTIQEKCARLIQYAITDA